MDFADKVEKGYSLSIFWIAGSLTKKVEVEKVIYRYFVDRGERIRERKKGGKSS